MTRSRALCGGFFVLVAFGCGGSTQESPAAPEILVDRPTAAAASTPAAPAAVPPPAPAAGQIGVAPCDEYIEKARACSTRMPAEGREAFESGLATSLEAWKEAAKEPSSREPLSAACKAALDALRVTGMCD